MNAPIDCEFNGYEPPYEPAMNRNPMKTQNAFATLAVVALASLNLGGAAQAQSASPDLSALHDALHLSVQQEDAWRAYRAAITPDPQADARHRQAAMMLATLSTPRRVDLIEAEMQEDAATLHRQGQAVKAFYGTLSPSQQRAFDQQTAPNAQRNSSGGSSLRQPPSNGMSPPR
jgi:hypothetical protein